VTRFYHYLLLPVTVLCCAMCVLAFVWLHFWSLADVSKEYSYLLLTRETVVLAECL